MLFNLCKTMIPQNDARSLLEKILDHPHGLEILRMVSELAPNVQAQKPDDLKPEKLELQQERDDLRQEKFELQQRIGDLRRELESNYCDNDGSPNCKLSRS